MRAAVRDTKRVATCLGFGPRFLHSTGQAYKGGPNTGVFLQITSDDAQDLAGAWPEVYVRGGESGAGAWRSGSIARTRPTRSADSSGLRCGSGPRETGFGDGPRISLESVGNSGLAPLAYARGSACLSFDSAPNGTATVRERRKSASHGPIIENVPMIPGEDSEKIRLEGPGTLAGALLRFSAPLVWLALFGPVDFGV